MSKPRRMTVLQQNPRWQEYDREILVAVWNNRHQPTVVDLSREEAANLRDLIEDFLRGEQ